MRTGPTETCASGSCGYGFAELQKLSDERLMVHLKGGHDDVLAILFDRYRRLSAKSQRQWIVATD
jgi:hypothetical protein